MHPENMAQAFELMNILERDLGFANVQDVSKIHWIYDTKSRVESGSIYTRHHLVRTEQHGCNSYLLIAPLDVQLYLYVP